MYVVCWLIEGFLDTSLVCGCACVAMLHERVHLHALVWSVVHVYLQAQDPSKPTYLYMYLWLWLSSSVSPPDYSQGTALCLFSSMVGMAAVAGILVGGFQVTMFTLLVDMISCDSGQTRLCGKRGQPLEVIW